MDSIISVFGIFSKTASFALQQNHVPIVRQLTLKNLSKNELKGLKVVIRTDPGIADEWTTEINSIMPEREYAISGINLCISASRLFELTERINGALIIAVSDESGVLAEEKQDLSILSYDEWTGANTFPEFLTAFITPNHPYITEIIKKA